MTRAADSSVDVFDQLRSRIDHRLALVLDETAKLARDRAADALPIVEQVRDLTMRGGKRLRPAMLLAAVECVEPWSRYETAVVDLGAAIEMLQTYLLIHDDWMDGDAMRRGGPTVHVALHGTYGGAHVGAAAAVLAGDFASAMAQGLCASDAVPPVRLHAVEKCFVAMQREVVLGQVLDLINSKDTDGVHDLKTGSYTVRGPLALGCALAGGDASVERALTAFAKPLGIAFQLRDDLIGSFGDERETGKSSSSDVRAGKRSATIAYALDALPDEARRELEGLLGHADTDARVARARALMEQAGTVSAIEARIGRLRDEALGALESGVLRSEGRALLTRLARSITDRRK